MEGYPGDDYGRSRDKKQGDKHGHSKLAVDQSGLFLLLVLTYKYIVRMRHFPAISIPKGRLK